MTKLQTRFEARRLEKKYTSRRKADGNYRATRMSSICSYAPSFFHHQLPTSPRGPRNVEGEYVFDNDDRRSKKSIEEQKRRLEIEDFLNSAPTSPTTHLPEQEPQQQRQSGASSGLIQLEATSSTNAPDHTHPEHADPAILSSSASTGASSTSAFSSAQDHSPNSPHSPAFPSSSISSITAPVLYCRV